MDGITAPLARFKKRASSMKQNLEPTQPLLICSWGEEATASAETARMYVHTVLYVYSSAK